MAEMLLEINNFEYFYFNNFNEHFTPHKNNNYALKTC